MKKFKVIIDRDLCIGCGGCAEICPEVFTMDSQDGKSKITSQEFTSKTIDAARSCPVNAIIIKDMDE